MSSDSALNCMRRAIKFIREPRWSVRVLDGHVAAGTFRATNRLVNFGLSVNPAPTETPNAVGHGSPALGDAAVVYRRLAGKTLYVPLHYYFIQGMDRMWAHLTQNTPLPPSQVVRATPRGGNAGSAPPITKANLPPIGAAPAAGDLITFSGTTVMIPD